MTSDEAQVERLRTYLRDLSPEARSLLITEIERGKLRGDEMPAMALVLQELRSAGPQPVREPARIGKPARMFFAPLEPFLVDDRPERKHPGRIARAALDPLWQWICRDLMPTEAKVYSEQIGQMLLAGETNAAKQLARVLQDRTVRRIPEAIAAAAADDKSQRRLARQVGTPQALDDLREIVGVLKVRDALAMLGSRLPAQITNLTDEQLENVKALLDSPVARHREIFLYAVLLVMSRLAAPWQLIRLAIKAAGTDAAARIADTPFAIAVTVVLADMERTALRLRGELKTGGPGVVALLREIHDSVRALRTEMDLSGDSPWARQLAALRGEVSAVLETEIESVPARVRRLLRPRPSKEIAPDSKLDSIDVAETEAAVELLGACRTFASELAINEVTLRVYSELQSYFDTGTQPLLDGLRSAGPTDRKFRLSQIDAAVRFASRIFGANYASLLAKAAEVAGQGERKAAKA